jgi:hypothetical protein
MTTDMPDVVIDFAVTFVSPEIKQRNEGSLSSLPCPDNVT